MTNNPETIALRATVIAGKRYDDDYTVIWRGLPIGRIMQALRGLTDQWPAPGMKQNTASSSWPLLNFWISRLQRWLRPSGLSRSYSIFSGGM